MTRISIDLRRRLGTVDRRIFGQFIEHIGRCIYGGVYDEGSPLADARGFRRDVLDAARPLRIPILRWPGGNFVSGYHWLDVTTVNKGARALYASCGFRSIAIKPRVLKVGDRYYDEELMALDLKSS